MNPSKLATLLSRVKDGDGAAFEELYRCYFHRVFAVALSILKNEEDGKDAAQTVMTKLLLLPMDAFPASGENTWLYVITKNEALGILRKKNRESSASPEFWADIPDPRSELDQLLDLEAYRKLVQPLDGISREIVTLCSGETWRHFFSFWPCPWLPCPPFFESPQPVRRVPPRLLRPLPWRFFPFSVSPCPPCCF